MGVRIGVFLLLAAFALAVIHVVCTVHVDAENLEGRKRYEYDLAEGFRLRHSRFPVDSVSFKSCRVEKMRKGPLTFGGFNVLLVEGLVLNLPFPNVESEHSSGTNEILRTSSRIGLSESVRSCVGLGKGKFSTIQIKGLTVNRIAGETVSLLFSAVQAKSHGKSLQLSECIVLENGISNVVGGATLYLKPARLAWKGGELDLKDLL